MLQILSHFNPIFLSPCWSNQQKGQLHLRQQVALRSLRSAQLQTPLPLLLLEAAGHGTAQGDHVSWSHGVPVIETWGPWQSWWQVARLEWWNHHSYIMLYRLQLVIYNHKLSFITYEDLYWLVVSTPLKNISQLGWLFPTYGKIKHVPNHQPDNDR